VIDLSTDGFPLAGAGLDSVEEWTAVALVYRHNRHLIQLFVVPAGRDASRTASARQGYNIRHWNDRGMSFRAVSDLNVEELGRFERLLRAAAEAEQPPAIPTGSDQP
jgi:anti-sigma factor RsiW